MMRMGGTEDLASCPVCSRGFRAKGDRIPRLLPCSHTVCESCVRGKLLKKYTLDCPQCGEVHTARNGMESFPSNRYILMYFRSKLEKQESKRSCVEHGREKNLFCNICKVPICVLCLKDEHKGHDFGDIQEAKKQRHQTLLSDVESLKKKLRRNKRMLLTVQDSERASFQTCIEQIKANKMELMKLTQVRYEEMVDDVYDKSSKFDARINNALTQISENLHALKDMEDNTDDAVTHADIADCMETVRRIKSQEMNSQPNVTRYSLVRFEENQTPSRLVQSLCGTLKYEEKTVNLAKLDTSADEDAAVLMTDGEDDVENTNEPGVVWSSLDSLALRKRQNLSVTFSDQQRKVRPIREKPAAATFSKQQERDSTIPTYLQKLLDKPALGSRRNIGSTFNEQQQTVGNIREKRTTTSFSKQLEQFRSMREKPMAASFSKQRRQFGSAQEKPMTTNFSKQLGQFRNTHETPMTATFSKQHEQFTSTQGKPMATTFSKQLEKFGSTQEKPIAAFFSKQQKKVRNIRQKQSTTEGSNLEPSSQPTTVAVHRAEQQFLRSLGTKSTRMETAVTEAPVAKKRRMERPNASVGSPLNWPVTKCLDMDYISVRLMSLMENGSVVVFGRVRNNTPGAEQPDQWAFSMYNLKSGVMLGRRLLEKNTVPDGVAIVNLAGCQCLALSYGHKMRLDFYDGNNFQFIKKSYAMAPFKPGRLCTSAPGVLLHVDSRAPQRVRWLDCSTYPPQCFKVTHFTFSGGTELLSPQDMCFVAHRGKELLITTHYMGGIQAYNAVTNSLEWTVKGKFAAGMAKPINARGIAADKKGRIFVCDINNNRVEMFSMDGGFLGNVMRFPAGEKPLKIRYCDALSCLFVCHAKKGGTVINMVKLQ